MTQPFQEELANALENLRNEREKNAKLESLNNHLQDELERAQHLLFLAENPSGAAEQKLVPVTVMVPADQVAQESEGFDALPFIPDQSAFNNNHE